MASPSYNLWNQVSQGDQNFLPDNYSNLKIMFRKTWTQYKPKQDCTDFSSMRFFPGMVLHGNLVMWLVIES